MYYYEVAGTKIIRQGADFLTYESTERLLIGSVVVIPVGKKQIVGVVFKEVAKPDFSTRVVSEVLSYVLPERLLHIAKWMSEYYATALPLVIQMMLPAGVTKKRRVRVIDETTNSIKSQLLLNRDQEKAIQEIRTSTQNTALLFGITGSGKTNVYVRLVMDAIETGKSAIVLVPEIALTTQAVEIFREFFGEKVCLIHSVQTEAEKHLVWERILKTGEPVVVIGPRSALFAPVRDLGVVIIDEAHELSYKQDQTPKYHALRVASKMANNEGVKAIFGTATPTVSDYYLAKKTCAVVRMERLAIESECEAVVKLVDSKNREMFRQKRFLSDSMITAMEETLLQKRQCLIFHNRRGSSSVTICEGCGWQALCKDCVLSLVLHKDLYCLLCHSCGKEYRMETSCPECSGTSIIHKGVGTKMLEQELKEMFPKVEVARFDSDTPNELMLSNTEIFRRVRMGEIQIVVGTQVVAKGLDLPNLGMVGVIQADLGLSLPDYSSEERAFQLLSQVIGRAKRGHRDTTVIVQTYQPNSEVIRYGIQQDYEGFYEYVLKTRKRGIFPPYCYLLKLVCTYKTEVACIKNVRSMTKRLKQDFPKVQILGPMPDFYEFKAGKHRWQIVVKSTKRAELLEILNQPLGVNWQFDLDPGSLL